MVGEKELEDCAQVISSADASQSSLDHALPQSGGESRIKAFFPKLNLKEVRHDSKQTSVVGPAMKPVAAEIFARKTAVIIVGLTCCIFFSKNSGSSRFKFCPKPPFFRKSFAKVFRMPPSFRSWCISVGTRTMSKMPAAAATDSINGINAVTNGSVELSHKPSPCPDSRLNAEAQGWWSSSANRSKTSLKRPTHGAAPGTSLQAPSNWPIDVVYITQSLVAPSIPESIAQRYVLQPRSSALPDNAGEAGPSKTQGLPRATHNDGRAETLYTTSIQEQVPLVIRPINDGTPWDAECFHSTSRNLKQHPAVGSSGLFAAEDIFPETFLRPYLGVLHTKADADFHSTYDLSLCHDQRLLSSDASDDVASKLDSLSLEAREDAVDHDPTAMYVDSRYWGNESRFVNDYRGIAPKANVEFRSFIQHSDDPQDDQTEKFQMGLFATRLIRKGQELVINYGKSYWVHHDQLEQLGNAKHKAELARRNKAAAAKSGIPTGAQLDPLQAMLQRSRMRVSRTATAAVNPQRPPQPPPSRTE